MSWNYAAKRCSDHGEVWYELCECFPSIMEKGEKTIPHTIDHINICADTPAELAEWLRKAADDVERYEPIEENDK